MGKAIQHVRGLVGVLLALVLAVVLRLVAVGEEALDRGEGAAFRGLGAAARRAAGWAAREVIPAWTCPAFCMTSVDAAAVACLAATACAIVRWVTSCMAWLAIC